MPKRPAIFLPPGLSLLVTLAIALSLPGAASAGEAGLLWDQALNLSSLPGRSFQSTLARDPGTGDLFAVWTDDGGSGLEEILARRWDQAGQVWLPAENLSASVPWQRDGGAALLFDDQGRGLLIWTASYAEEQGAPHDGHDLLWRLWNGAAWSPPAVLMHGDAYLPGSPATFDLIPVKVPDGILLFIVWGTGYRTASFDFDTGAWSGLSPWDYRSINVALAQVICDAGGVLHAAAYGPNSFAVPPNDHFHDAYYLTYDARTGWSRPQNLSAFDGVASSVALAFDSAGRLHFLWSDPAYRDSTESLKSAIWERVLQAEGWTPNREVTVDNDRQAINGFSLAAGGDGALHLAWSEGIGVAGAHNDLDIYYRSGDGLAWGPEEKVYTSLVDSRYPLVTGGDGAGQGAALLWQEIFAVAGSLYDHEVFVAQQVAGPKEYHRSYLPFALQR